jgi:hypothetical protein
MVNNNGRNKMKKGTLTCCLILLTGGFLCAVEPDLLEDMEAYLGKAVPASAIKPNDDSSSYIISQSAIDESTNLIIRCMVTDGVVKIITRVYRCSDINTAEK